MFIEHLNSTLNELENTIELLKTERVRLSLNSETEAVTERIRETEKKLEEQMMFIIKSKQAFQKIMTVYGSTEERIKSVVEDGYGIGKRSFKDSSEIYDNTGFEWSVI